MKHHNEPAMAEVNRDQRDYWATAGPRQYQQHADRFAAMTAPFGQAVFDAVRPQPGERVLDVGCGHGATTIDAAALVGPTGHVVGVDVSAAMLQPARNAVAAAGLDNVTLLEADAQVHPFEAASFDVLISRFGVMFFDDPQAAFTNLARALRPGGRLAFVCWREPSTSQWIALAIGAAVTTLGRMPELGAPGVPGPWALADRDRLVRLLGAAGFREVAVDNITRPQRVGADIDDAVAFILSLPESHQLFDGVAAETVAAADAAMRAAFAPYAGPDGVVADASAWLASARR